MNKLELWFFRRILRKMVRQGHLHQRRIIGVYTLIAEAARNEFYEDNLPTLDANLKFWFETALRTPEAIGIRGVKA
jgi:hypothetical protein